MVKFHRFVGFHSSQWMQQWKQWDSRNHSRIPWIPWFGSGGMYVAKGQGKLQTGSTIQARARGFVDWDDSQLKPVSSSKNRWVQQVFSYVFVHPQGQVYDILWLSYRDVVGLTIYIWMWQDLQQVQVPLACELRKAWLGNVWRTVRLSFFA